jgi:fatty-acyl-CoA synthase
MIISGGENLYPSEVESMLGAHEHVKEVAVIGAADPKWGERVDAVMVLHTEVPSTEDELLAWCRDRIAGYKRPRSICFKGDKEVPRTVTHRVLKSRYSERDT